MGTVGTTKVFEDERIIVWEFVLAPGEKTPVHTHEHDYIFYVLEGAPLQVYDAEDRELGQFDASTGAVFALKCEGGELISLDGRGHRVPATHSARNLGATRYREILVETK
jgi:predicted metal-dependent enzyme (double-stranded beta helix superfamily)